MSKVTPVLSVIIPVLDESEQIAHCLLQLQKCCPKKTEIIVVDGGSSDDTIAQASPLADQVIDSERGRAIQMNAGAARASGDYLLFLHADTLLPQNFSEVVQFWLTQTVLWGFFRVRLSGEHWLLRWVERGMNIRSRLTGIATGDQCVFVRRDVFQQAGGFPRQLLMEDIELSKRLKKYAAPVCMPKIVTTSSRRWEQKGILKTILHMWCLRLAYFLGVSVDTLVRQYYPDYQPCYCGQQLSSQPYQYLYTDSCIVQFARSPQSGRVKTRLQGVLGESGCLALHKALVEHQFNRLRSSAVAPLELWVSDSSQQLYFAELIGDGIERMVVQKGDSLGERMADCIEDRLTCYSNVVLIGSDCPAIDDDYIVAAISALNDGADVVLGPAEDGGYVLIGMRRFDCRVFEGVPWGTEQVMAVTEQKLMEMGWCWQRLSVLQDIDRPEDLGALRQFPGLLPSVSIPEIMAG